MNGAVLFSIVLVGLVVIGALIVVSNVLSPDPVRVVLNDSNVTVVYDSVFIESNAPDVSYVLRNGSNNYVLLSGKLLGDAVERFDRVVENSTVILEAYSNMYYYNSTSCFVGYWKNNLTNNLTVLNSHCRVNLAKKAVLYQINLSEDNLRINASDGLLQNVTVCFHRDVNIVNILMSLPEVHVPSGLILSYDQCFTAADVVYNQIYPFTARRNPNVDEVLPLRVLVFDYEKPGYGSVGARSDFRYI